ncbi:MAG: nucleoside recognition domain-containing protein, partial [Bacteroidota bacterium]
MLLNRIFIAMFLIGFSMAAGKLLFYEDVNIFKQMVDALFDSAKSGFELALFLTGALCLWMGFMRVGEKGGAVKVMSKLVSPLFRKLFPEVPSDHPAVGSMMMNFSANMLGLDNAATPLGLKAMKELQELNPEPEKATNAQIMFLVLNTSGLTLIPVSILAYRSVAGSSAPSEVFLPILLATFCSTIIGMLYVSIRQKVNILHPVILGYLGGLIAFVVGLLYFVWQYPVYTATISNVGGNLLLILIIASFLIMAMRKKVNVYEEFIEGAKGGFEVAITIVPYLVAMLAALAIFRTSGALNEVLKGVEFTLLTIGITATEFVDALPVALMKPFSGSGARGLMLEVFETHGVDSFAGKVAATFQGSTETTFYVLAVYFGSVGVKNT